MSFSFLGHKFKLKFEMSHNFELQSLELGGFFCITEDSHVLQVGT
jgi:hypothetical protein